MIYKKEKYFNNLGSSCDFWLKSLKLYSAFIKFTYLIWSSTYNTIPFNFYLLNDNILLKS